MRDYLGQITTPTTLAITTPTYTVPRTSALALDMLKLSLRKNSAALLKAGISNPLARPAAGTGLYYTIYDRVKDYAVSLLRRSVPFYYETITGERRAVQSTTRANAAIDYIPQTIKLWGYVRSTVHIRPEPTPVYTPPVTIHPEPTPVYTPPYRPEPTPVYTPPYRPEPTPVYTPPYITPEITPAPVSVEEDKVILWAVSYTLTQAGHTAYPMQKYKRRIAVSEQVFNSLVDRAKYIADQMVQQNTYSPRL
jgi:hypothetical protein